MSRGPDLHEGNRGNLGTPCRNFPRSGGNLRCWWSAHARCQSESPTNSPETSSILAETSSILAETSSVLVETSSVPTEAPAIRTTLPGPRALVVVDVLHSIYGVYGVCTTQWWLPGFFCYTFMHHDMTCNDFDDDAW